MKNRLICLEGSIDFEEEIMNQAINIISFRSGQQITINRERRLPGHTFTEQMSLQLENAQKIFNQFNFIKMDELTDSDLFAEIIQVMFTFISGSGQRVWQVTFACCINRDDVINFTSVYPDEPSMEREIGRLRHCTKHFVLNTTLDSK